jgi:hypothetical protein
MLEEIEDCCWNWSKNLFPSYSFLTVWYTGLPILCLIRHCSCCWNITFVETRVCRMPPYVTGYIVCFINIYFYPNWEKLWKLSMLNATYQCIETVFTLMFYVQFLFILNLFQFGPNTVHHIWRPKVKSPPASHHSVWKVFNPLLTNVIYIWSSL